jgi:phage-related holin
MKHLNDIPGIESLSDPLTTKVVIMAMTSWAAISAIFNKYIFADWDFGFVLALFVLLDTSTGIWKAWKLKRVSSHKLGGVFTKIVLYAVVLMVVHGLTNFSGGDRLLWVKDGVYLGLLVREGLSILENVSRINPNLVPKWLLVRLSEFDEQGKPIDNPSNPQNDA